MWSVLPNKLITKREAADILGVVPSGVHRIMREHGLTVAQEVGGGGKRPAMLLFRRSEVERIQRQRTRAAS